MSRRTLRLVHNQPFAPAHERNLLGSLNSMLLLVPFEAGAGKAAELDRELLACCAEAVALDAEAALAMDGIDSMDDDDPAVMDAVMAANPLFLAYADAIERATQLAARSPEGLRAKGALLQLHICTEQDPTALAASLARDVAGRAWA